MLKKINDIKIYTVVLFLIFTGKSVINLNSQQYFYGDDSWLLLGSRFDSLLDSLRCCAVSHPVFTIFAQSVFKILASGLSTMLFLSLVMAFFGLGFGVVVSPSLCSKKLFE